MKTLKDLTDLLFSIARQKCAYKIEVLYDGHAFHWHIKLPNISAEDFRRVTRPDRKETNPGVAT